MSEPPRKRSKWETDETALAAAEEERVEKERKRAKRLKQTSERAASKLTAIKSSNNSNNSRNLHYLAGLHGCRSVYCYERLNHIEEGSYGVVSRARDKETGEMFGQLRHIAAVY